MNDIEKMGEAIKSLTDVISSKEKNYGGDGSNAKPKKPQSEAFIDTNAMDEEDMEKEARKRKPYEEKERKTRANKNTKCLQIWVREAPKVPTK